jgi:HEPN domain-containing protein
MKPPPRAEAERWLAQAKSDLDFARLGLREGFFAQACFQCQQAAEKALKALHYLAGARFVPGHSLVELLAPLAALDPSLAALQEAARRLDQLYIPTRYPNGLPGGVPAQVFSQAQAAEAIAQATTFLERAGATIG